MIALIDYGIGNLRSVQKALEHVGAEVTLTSDPEVIVAADIVVLSGEGAFGDGMKGMKARDLINPVKEVIRVGTPLLGICVGMQLFFEESEEHGRHAGLGILSGRVKRFEPDPGQKGLKVPQTG
jgi:imidazole glycerol-phosphate synthase subunit HisH